MKPFNQSFGAQIKILPQSQVSKFHINLQEFVNRNGYIIEEYAEKHGFKDINLCLKKVTDEFKKNQHGDCLIINADFKKQSCMRFDNTTTDLETRKTILQNIQDSYNLLNPKK